MAICLGNAISFERLLLDKSSLLILKYLATVSLTKSDESTFSFAALNSFIVFSANSIVIGVCVSEAVAIILLNTPSNSLIFESILFAILDKIVSSTIIFYSCAFFLKIAKRVS